MFVKCAVPHRYLEYNVAAQCIVYTPTVIVITFIVDGVLSVPFHVD